MSGSFVTDNNDCNGASLAIVASTDCLVPMASILYLTQLPVDYLIKVQIRAHNAKGWGAFSELNTGTATVETLPSTMNAPTFDLNQTTNN